MILEVRRISRCPISTQPSFCCIGFDCGAAHKGIRGTPTAGGRSRLFFLRPRTEENERERGRGVCAEGGLVSRTLSFLFHFLLSVNINGLNSCCHVPFAKSAYSKAFRVRDVCFFFCGGFAPTRGFTLVLDLFVVLVVILILKRTGASEPQRLDSPSWHFFFRIIFNAQSGWAGTPWTTVCVLTRVCFPFSEGVS